MSHGGAEAVDEVHLSPDSATGGCRMVCGYIDATDEQYATVYLARTNKHCRVLGFLAFMPVIKLW